MKDTHCRTGTSISLFRTRGALTALLAAIFCTVAVLALSTAVFAASGSESAPTCPPSGSNVGFLGFSDALDKQSFEGTAVGGLSALAYGGRDTYYSLVDNGPNANSPARFYAVDAPVERSGPGNPEIEDVTTLRDGSGEPFTASNLDGEGLVRERDGGLLVASETEPSIRRFSGEGELLGELPVPEKFLLAPQGGGRENQTFESLSLSPNGRSLFTANEGYLAPDGETADGSDRLRILRYEDRGPGGSKPAEEFYYLAEPGQGVVETLALSEEELLVLERGFVAGEGNTVRIFKVSLAREKDVSGEPSLAAPGLQTVKKELVVDLADCPPSGAGTPGEQENPLLDNFEAMSFGPRLAGGERSISLASDDNFNDAQVTRIVSLGLEPEKPKQKSRGVRRGS